MPLRPARHRVEKFGRRLEWIRQNLDPVPLPRTRFQGLRDLWSFLRGTGETDVVYRSMKRYTSPSQDFHNVPDSVIRAVCTAYPDMPEDVLIKPSFAEFQCFAEPITAARSRWINAVRFLAEHRDVLADVGKRYHHSVDADPAFPVIVRPGWILRTPVELTETSALPLFDRYVRERPARHLPGLNVDFVALRQRLMPRKRPLFDGESYRVLEVQPSADDLKLTFGPTQYFQIVNTCEAIAAELADYVANNPGRIPDNLDLRGSPDAVFDFRDRSTYAVVACLLMIKNYSANVHSRSRYRDQFLLHIRGEETVESQNVTAVVPAGGHQPHAAGYGDHKEVSLWRTVVREFCEELFDKEDAVRARRHGESFLDLPEVKEYVDVLFRKGNAKVFLMGAGLDPVTTKCEFLIAIVIDWKKALRKMELHVDENYEGEVRFIDLTRDNLLAEANVPRPGKVLYPSSKACLLLGAQHFDFLLSSV